MYKLKILFLLTFFLALNSCSEQEKDVIYIFLEDGKPISCVKPKTNKKADTSTVGYQGKMQKLDSKTFFFCQERFVKIDDNKNVSSKEFEEINFVSHSFLYQEYIKRAIFSKKDTFKDIYLRRSGILTSILNTKCIGLIIPTKF
ncbi:hypothetical protein H2O64_06105 [Kordia sp. YSTF-M3]|uniref:Lipoprotein n=1 Tax=Kordia aestuariivivens TaxID=2759037 RepID=A0ABR7Q6T6_9FLAO|nr:hypothetical protein [Kordia aestuariivivens]MBC8754237.1 hypothetical protein [Kordia aestuariivivens]